MPTSSALTAGRPCPGWDYADVAGYTAVLTPAVAELLRDLANGDIDTRVLACDTRTAHERMFRNLTPPGYPHYAGNYRGAPLPCLGAYEVHIKSDPRVGRRAALVDSDMSQLATQLSQLIVAIDSGSVPRADRLRVLIRASCEAFERFLRIHPYANGNGHAARFLVWCILGRYGHFPRTWPVEPRPTEPHYTNLLVRYRNGERAPLEAHFLGVLLSSGTA